MKDNSFWKIHVKWGLMLGVLLIIIEILKMFARKVDYQASQLLDLAMIIGIILILFHGVREFKENYSERLSFAKAFLSTVVMSAIAAVVIFGYDMLHYSVIEKDGLQQKYNVALAKYKSNLAKDTITAQELDSFVDTTMQIINLQKNVVELEFADNQTLCDEVDAGTNIFQQYYSQKLKLKSEQDNESYKLGEFNQYARKTLVETLESYIGQNEDKESTPYVQKIVQNTNQELQDVSPLEWRFEKNKKAVPRYDKNGKYAAVSALIYLLYGMFFGIFVAIFHYRSKNAIDEPESIEQDQEQTTEE